MNINFFELLSIILFVFKMGAIAGLAWGVDTNWIVVFLPALFGIFWSGFWGLIAGIASS